MKLDKYFILLRKGKLVVMLRKLNPVMMVDGIFLRAWNVGVAIQNKNEHGDGIFLEE